MNYYQNYSQSYTYPPIRKRQKNKHFMKLVYIFIGVFLIFVVTAVFNERSKLKPVKLTAEQKEQAAKLVSAKEQSEGQTLGANWSFNLFGSEPSAAPTPTPIKQDEKLVSLIKEKIPSDNGTYSVVVKQLGSEEPHQAFINADQVLEAASLYKLYLMATAYQQIENGTITEKTTITSSTNHLEQVLGGKEFGYEDYENGAISYTVDQTLHRIAEVSDNYAAIMLAEKVDWDNVRKFASDLGATHTTIKSPISTSASDIANFFDLLYQKKLVSPAASDKMIELLAGSQLNNRIPDQLPRGLKIAHKTGELAGVRHDAGIVFLEKTPEDEKSCNKLKRDGVDCTCETDKENPANSKYQCNNKGPYVIVMMSNDVKLEDSAIDTLSDISKVVYEYFNSAE